MSQEASHMPVATNGASSVQETVTTAIADNTPAKEPSGQSQAPKKSKKIRKGQSEEEFLAQKVQFEETGPLVNTENWLYEDLDLDKTKKTDRVKLLHACEKAYYNKDYSKCMDIIAKAEQIFGVSFEDEEAIKQTKEEFETAGKKVRKSAKMERHVVDLLYIKEKCLEKIEGRKL